METYPRAAAERAMKIQEGIMRAMAKNITWAQAGEIIGLCERLPQELRLHGIQSVASGQRIFARELHRRIQSALCSGADTAGPRAEPAWIPLRKTPSSTRRNAVSVWVSNEIDHEEAFFKARISF